MTYSSVALENGNASIFPFVTRNNFRERLENPDEIIKRSGKEVHFVATVASEVDAMATKMKTVAMLNAGSTPDDMAKSRWMQYCSDISNANIAAIDWLFSEDAAKRAKDIESLFGMVFYRNRAVRILNDTHLMDEALKEFSAPIYRTKSVNVVGVEFSNPRYLGVNINVVNGRDWVFMFHGPDGKPATVTGDLAKSLKFMMLNE